MLRSEIIEYLQMVNDGFGRYIAGILDGAEVLSEKPDSSCDTVFY